jgi:hypothetical protein
MADCLCSDRRRAISQESPWSVFAPTGTTATLCLDLWGGSQSRADATWSRSLLVKSFFDVLSHYLGGLVSCDSTPFIKTIPLESSIIARAQFSPTLNTTVFLLPLSPFFLTSAIFVPESGGILGSATA